MADLFSIPVEPGDVIVAGPLSRNVVVCGLQCIMQRAICNVQRCIGQCAKPAMQSCLLCKDAFVQMCTICNAMLPFFLISSLSALRAVDYELLEPWKESVVLCTCDGYT